MKELFIAVGRLLVYGMIAIHLQIISCEGEWPKVRR